MSHLILNTRDVIRAWKDPEYRLRLSKEARNAVGTPRRSNRTLNTAFAAAAALLALSPPSDVRAETAAGTTSQPRGSLGLGESGGEPRGYAFLFQVLPEGRTPQVYLDLRPESTVEPPDPERWTWKVDNSDSTLKSQLTMKWYGQASCPDDLTLLQVSGPGGTLTQNPLQNPIWGYFQTQSFTLDTVKDVCVNWANAQGCAPGDPGCPHYETFDLVGGVNPAAPADGLRLKASCASGPLPDAFYAPQLRLRCNRGE